MFWKGANVFSATKIQLFSMGVHKKETLVQIYLTIYYLKKELVLIWKVKWDFGAKFEFLTEK